MPPLAVADTVICWPWSIVTADEGDTERVSAGFTVTYAALEYADPVALSVALTQ